MKQIPLNRLHDSATMRGIDPGFSKKAVRCKNNNEESRIQKAVIKWWSWRCKDFDIPEQLLFAIPNGGRRSAISGSILKKEGLRVGCPDLFLAAPSGNQGIFSGASDLPVYKYAGMFLEMKTDKGVVSVEQFTFHALLIARGYRVEVCRSVEAAIKTIEDYLSL